MWSTGLVALQACGIFPDQRWNPVSPALAGRFLSTVPLGKPQALFWILEIGSEQNRKTHVMGKSEGGRTTEDEMVGWRRRLNGHEFEQVLGDGEEQGSLACCSLRGRKELDTTE